MGNRSPFGGFEQGDGTVDFYTRLSGLADPSRVVIDLGAGRGEWFEDDDVAIRQSLRLLRGKFREVIALDVDRVVLSNRSADRTAVIERGKLPIDDDYADVIVCDYVLEHIDDVPAFVGEVSRVLKRGGWFCARTPHKYHYVSMAARMLGSSGDRLLPLVQPGRKEIDIFPKRYKLNTLRDLRRAFAGYDDHSCIFRTAPAYSFGSATVKAGQDLMHRVMPATLSGNIFAFLRRPGD